MTSPSHSGPPRTEGFNSARFFVEHRQIAWVLLVVTLAWGWLGFIKMPRSKDPNVPVRLALAVAPWPGVSAPEVEQQLTRLLEERIAESSAVHPATADAYGIRSTSLPGLAVVSVQLAENVRDSKREFSDIRLKLDALNSRLPAGAGPIQFLSDFGDTAALMLTVASPRMDEAEIALRARLVREAVARVRPAEVANRAAIVYSFPAEVPAAGLRRGLERFVQTAVRDGVLSDPRPLEATGFVGVDAATSRSDAALEQYVRLYLLREMQSSVLHPDAWGPVVVRDPAGVEERIRAVAGDKYTYRQLDDFTDLIARSLASVPEASKYQRSGVLSEQITLEYSQERLAAHGVQPSQLIQAVQGHNTSSASGAIEAGGRFIYLSSASGGAAGLAGLIVGQAADGTPVHLRDWTDVNRGYETPARYLNYFTHREADGQWRRSRAVTVAIFMRVGEQVEKFGRALDERLAVIRPLLPADLIVARTSDQPRQVQESIGLFMDALYEAIILVVLVSLIGFWEWRSALLMALSIPITLAMTFGFMAALGLDLQQVSIASLIIALGLLVDDPVVAGDAIKRSLSEGRPALVAAWFGPVQLGRAILFATITNVAAYLPFLMLSGDTGQFLVSLPLVMAASLIASRIVSMTFIPLLGYYLLRPGRVERVDWSDARGFTGFYVRLARWAIAHRWRVLAGATVLLLAGFSLLAGMKTLFFPDDVQYWATVDVRLPNNASVAQTNETLAEVERAIREEAEVFGRERGRTGGNVSPLRALTTFVGGGGPRFWFSVSPEFQQANYGQIILEIDDKNLMPALAAWLQPGLVRRVAGARIEVNQLQTSPVEFPVEVMISSLAAFGPGQQAADMATLRRLTHEVEGILRGLSQTGLVRCDWEDETLGLGLQVDPERARLAGYEGTDVTSSVAASLNGRVITMLREDNKQIPVVARLAPEEVARLGDLQNLYVHQTSGGKPVPLAHVAELKPELTSQRIIRRDRFRTMSVVARPRPGVLASELLAAAEPKLKELQRQLPPGYRMVIGGEKAKEVQGFGELAMVIAISIAAIFVALVLQFDHVVKPLLVFAAVPFGVAGAVVALFATGTPFGFMAFLGITSLVGVIVSHVIVFFDFIEEQQVEGVPLEQALVSAGLLRLRPVMVTVGATVLALFPLALHGGPLWQPLCYSQIGGLAIATFVTLLLMPVLYSIVVLDLRWVRWSHRHFPTAEE